MYDICTGDILYGQKYLIIMKFSLFIYFFKGSLPFPCSLPVSESPFVAEASMKFAM